MGEIKDEVDWEIFLDNYFDLFRPLTEKKESESSFNVCYTKNQIYVWCELSVDKQTINKLEFGRLIIDEHGGQETNWIKGVFINDEHSYKIFLQTSFDSEYFNKRSNYQIKFDGLNKNIVTYFLKAPCLTGWIEEEFFLDQDKFYKVVVTLDYQKWTIKIRDVGEQDIPFATDIFNIWLRVKMADSFINNKRRKVNKLIVKPMNA